MKPIRVKITVKHANPDRPLDYMAAFEGMTGTVVWSDKTGWGEYSVAVELDGVHPNFGKFARGCYMQSRRASNDLIAEPIDGSTIDDVMYFTRLLGGSWNRYHDEHGDPLPWSVMEEKVAKLENKPG